MSDTILFIHVFEVTAEKERENFYEIVVFDKKLYYVKVHLLQNLYVCLFLKSNIESADTHTCIVAFIIQCCSLFSSSFLSTMYTIGANIKVLRWMIMN